MDSIEPLKCIASSDSSTLVEEIQCQDVGQIKLHKHENKKVEGGDCAWRAMRITHLCPEFLDPGMGPRIIPVHDTFPCTRVRRKQMKSMGENMVSLFAPSPRFPEASPMVMTYWDDAVCLPKSTRWETSSPGWEPLHWQEKKPVKVVLARIICVKCCWKTWQNEDGRPLHLPYPFNCVWTIKVTLFPISLLSGISSLEVRYNINELVKLWQRPCDSSNR